jgi:MFS family permease
LLVVCSIIVHKLYIVLLLADSLLPTFAVLGSRCTLFLGTLGYALYVGALWSLQTQGVRWFLVFAAAIQGVTAALLWSAQGSIMMSYPLERDKGKAFAIFWAILQFGSFIGSIIALAINLRSGRLSAVSTSTYIVSRCLYYPIAKEC